MREGMSRTLIVFTGAVQETHSYDAIGRANVDTQIEAIGAAYS
jgi:hypothetical protein